MTPRERLLGACLASLAAIALGVLAAWPIYQTPWLFVSAGAGLVLGTGIAAWGARRLSLLATVGVLLAAFVLTVVPVAVPQSFERMPAGLFTGLVDGLAAVSLGWKQLLTLTLPVGGYQTVLVPAYLVFLFTAFTATTLAVRVRGSGAARAAGAAGATGLARRDAAAPLAALPLLVPVAFGTIFGASAVSAPLHLGPLTIVAPRELALWAATALLGSVWVWFSAGAERRAALRRGRQAGERPRGTGRGLRALLGGATVLFALFAGLALAPVLDVGARQVPRDRIDPEIVLRERPSPLSAYRASKRDDSLDALLFEVTGSAGAGAGAGAAALPERLRLAVLDSYDGVDFHVSQRAGGRFSRFPSAPRVSDPVTVTVRIGEGYHDIWVPTSELGSVPVFIGPRAGELNDAFYLNRDTGAAIAVPGGSGTQGFTEGDGLRAEMQAAPALVLDAPPRSTGPITGPGGVDLDAMPELVSWLEAQDQPATAEGLTELVSRLRDRGYLSHSISDNEGERLWLERLAERYGTRFETSPGGHTTARIEQLFAQLNAQQRFAGEDPEPEMLVAGIGDDEQFATAAALIARALGYESRVVLGIRLGGEDAGVPGVPACSGECTGAHLAAWIEVRGAQSDWVPMDATPQLELRPTTLEEGEQLPEFPTTPEERDAQEVDPPLGLGERSDDAGDPLAEAATAWIWPVLRVVGLSLGALLLLALPLLFLPLAKRLRAKRRRAQSDPELRALGAWQQMLDRASDVGVRFSTTGSRAEAAEALGTEPARWAAETVDRAVFSPAGIDAVEADRLWEAVEEDRAQREAGMSFWQRLRAGYALGSYGVRLGKTSLRAKESSQLMRLGDDAGNEGAQ